MVASLSYRGPDSKGIFTDEGISLGHNRLSIIDLSASANQPMYDNRQELVMVFNGEIYNFKELKKELESEYKFKTQSDTEVILAGYRKWGKEVVNKLNGMFAFAIWDKRDNSLFCARDYAGMKPFYYFWDGKRFIFASEMQTVLTHGIPRKLNMEAFSHYFRVLYAPEPMTMIENIYKLPASHTLVLKDNSLSIEKYGNKSVEKTTLSYREMVISMREKVLSAVKRHLVSDVPVGVYLSGGIDSSTILFSMSQFRNNIQTFTVGFNLKNKEEENKFNHDAILAARTAVFFGSEHHKITLSEKDVLDSFEKMSAHNSDPISNPTSIAMMLLAQFAKKKVSVSLTGNAGDELFGGYDRYRMALAAYYYKKLPEFLRAVGNYHSRIAKLDYKSEIDLFAQFMFEKDHKLSYVINPAVFAESSKTKAYFEKRYLSEISADPAESFMRVDQKTWLPEHFFMLSDKMSMASALEERMPFADKELIAFSESLPRSFKVDIFRTKKIMKDAFRNDLPEFLFSEPKRGWFSPAAKWLRNPAFSIFARQVLSEDYYNGTGKLFNWPAAREMLERHIEKKEYNLNTLWALLTFQTWAKTFKITL